MPPLLTLTDEDIRDAILQRALLRGLDPWQAQAEANRVLLALNGEPEELDNQNRYDFPEDDYRTNGSN